MNIFKLKSWRVFFFITAPLVLVSCFNITEEYHFNNDGSGTAKFQIDMSQVISLMQTFIESDSTGNSQKSMDSLFSNEETINALHEIPGIFDINNTSNAETGIVEYTYSFKNLDALNKAILVAKGGSSMGIDMNSGQGKNLFTVNKKTLKRIFEVTPDNNKSDDAENAMVQMMFKDATYKVIYSFDSKIKKASGANTKISGDKKSVTMETQLLSIINGEAKMNCTIKTK